MLSNKNHWILRITVVASCLKLNIILEYKLMISKHTNKKHIKTCFEILKSDANWYNCTNMSRLFLNTYNVISFRNTLKFEQMAQRMVRQQSDSWIALSKSSDQKPL